MSEERTQTGRRPYEGRKRAEQALRRKAEAVRAAIAILREARSPADLSLDATAKAAGITRLTIYNQFGSRRGLIEAVFERLAEDGGIVRLKEALALADPLAGLDHVVEVFVRFWTHEAAVSRVYELMSADAELRDLLKPRIARGADVVAVLVGRVAGCAAAAETLTDTAELILCLCDCPSVLNLLQGRAEADVEGLLKAAVRLLVSPLRTPAA